MARAFAIRNLWRAAVDRLKAISHGPPAAKPDSAGSRRSQSLCASGRPNDLPAGLGADAQESVTVGGDAPAGISLLDCAAVQRTWVMAVTAHMEATCPDAELPRHPLAPIVATWQRRIRNVEPYRPKKRASLPRLHRVGEHDVDAAGLPSSLECAPRSAPPELPDLRFAGKNFPSWLLWLFDRAAVRAQGSGAPWAVRLFIGALLHLDMANRHGYWRTLRLPTNYVVSWLQPNGWANKRRDWQRFPTALTDLRDRLAAVPVPEIGLVTLMYPSVIPQRPSDPWVEFTIRVPLSAARGARIDWPLLCRYGQESAALYRTYLIVAHHLDRSAHRGDVEEHLPHRVGRIIGVGPQGQLDLTSQELVGNLTSIGHRAGQPVELGHDERVAGAHGDKGLIETGPCASAPGQAVIGVDALRDHPESDQGRALRCEVLPISGAAGVSDADSFHGTTVRSNHLH